MWSMGLFDFVSDIDPSEGEIIAVRSAYARAVKRRLEAADTTLSPASKRELQGRVALDWEG